MRALVGSSIAAIVSCGLFGQSAGVPAAFDVASVKPASATSRQGADFRVLPGGTLQVTNLNLRVIIEEAFGVKAYQISGGPGWFGTDEFDIEAKADGNANRGRVMAMLRTLLAERFQLKVHRETREGNVYVLVVAKNGPNLKAATGEQSFVRLYRNTPTDQPGVSYTIAGQKASLALLAERLADMQLDRPVLDRTGIKGEFDFKLDYAIDDNPDSGPSIFSAIQEQLGLKLEAAKGPVETLVIDHVERPSGN
jgi:uncharacterized protein (TIGR03435 family)